MMAFAVIAAIFVVAALACVLPILMRRERAQAPVDAGTSNLAILRDELAELERDYANSLIGEGEFGQSRRELERRALEEARADAARTEVPSIGHGTKAALVLAGAIPIVAVLLYLQLGTPAAISQQATAASHTGDPTQQQVEAMVEQLAKRLAAAPDDAQGWALLARSFFVLERFHEAAAAYARAAQLITDDADLLADYADALAMSQGRRIDDKVMAIVERALKVDPTHWKALALAGSAAYDRKDYAGAIRYWETLRQRAAPGSEFGRMIDANIAEARQLAGGSAPPQGPMSAPPRVAAAPTPPQADSRPAQRPASAGGVSGTVRLSAELASKVAPSDTLFVFARAAEGPRQPLAIIRHQVKDLPLAFNLDDTHAMAPQLKLSNFSEVIVSARVSKSGQAVPQSGDLLGATQKIKVGSSGVQLVINSVVP